MISYDDAVKVILDNTHVLSTERQTVKAGDRIPVLPLDWRHHQFQPASRAAAQGWPGD